jgi:hypothetical protein
MRVIELPDKEADALAAKAAAAGLTLEDWLMRLAATKEPAPGSQPSRPIWETIADNMKRFPAKNSQPCPRTA